MGLHAWKRWLVINVALGVLVPGALVTRASAEDEEVSRRLTKYGKLSGAEARKVATAVSARMKRAADMTNGDDPMRSAVCTALYDAPAPADAMGAAKVRLRLYAGLNEWALDSLFAPRPGALATCTSQYGLRGKDCEALLAASGRMSPAEASRVGAGAPIATTGMAAARPAAAPRQAPQAAAPAQQSRFGRYDSGFRGGAQPQYPQPQYQAQPQYAAQPGYGAARPAYPAYGARPAPAYPAYGAQPRYGAQPGYAAQRPMPAQGYAAAPMARPMPVAQPRPVVAPPPNPAMVANRKAEYARKRQEYLERKKAEMEARKTKIVATAGGTAPVQRGLLSAEEAAAVGLEPSQPAAKGRASEPVASKASAKPSASKSAPAAAAAAPEEVAEAPAETAKAEKPALETDFLDGLMDNPLGKK